MVYAIAFILAIIGIAYNRRFSDRMRVFYMTLICIYVILVIGLRYRVGIDTINYMSRYLSVPTWESYWSGDILEERFEPGYMIVCMICKSIIPDFWLLQLVMATITNGCIFIFLYRHCKNPFVGIFLYFIFQCMYFSVEIIRESAAVGIFLVNYKNLIKRNWIKYYLFCILSILFHYSAIIILLFPLVRYLKFNYIYIILCFGIISITPLVENLNTLILFSAITDRVSEQLTSIETLNLNWRIVEFTKTGIPALLSLAIAYKYKIPQQFKSIILLQFILSIGAFEIPIIFARFINYTSLFVIISLSNIFSIDLIKNNFKAILLCTLILTQAKYNIEMYRAWNPYVSIINKTIIQEREDLWWQYFH